MSVSENVKEAAARAKDATDRAADRGHEFAERTRERAHDAADSVREKTHHAADTVREKSHGATEQVKRGGHRLPPGLWVALLLIAVAVGAYLLGRVSGKKSAPPAQAAAPQKPPAPAGPPTVTLDPQQLQYAAVQTSAAPSLTLPVKLTTTGTVAANLNHQASVMARLGGKVTQVGVNVGQSVRAGQSLLTISSPDLFNAQAAYRDAVLRRAAARAELLRLRNLAGLGQFGRATLEQARTYFSQVQGEIQADKDAVNIAQAQVVQAQAQADLTQKQLTRAQALYAALLLSRQDSEQAEANAAQAATALAAARSNLRQATDRQVNAQKRGQIARRDLARQTSLSTSGALNAAQVGPAFSAYVLAAHEVEASAANVRQYGGLPMDESGPGAGLLQVVAPLAGTVSDRAVMLGETVTPGMPLMTVLDLRTVVVQLAVYQEDLAHVRAGQRVVVTSNTAPGVRFVGTVGVVGAALDPNTRTATVACLIQNPNGALRPGAYVTGVLFGASRRDAVAVPSDAVQVLNGGHVVFTPTGKAGEFAATPVGTGETVNGLTEIKSGLAPGAQYVSRNAFVLKSQMIKDTLD